MTKLRQIHAKRRRRLIRLSALSNFDTLIFYDNTFKPNHLNDDDDDDE